MATSTRATTTRKTWKTAERFLKDLVPQEGTPLTVRKVLIWAGPTAAALFMDSARKQLDSLFDNAKTTKFVCITTEEEIKNNAAADYLKKTDGIVVATTDEFSDVKRIVAHAVEQKVDAVWVGFPPVAIKPELPQQLSKRDIHFLGPPHCTMVAIGDTIKSTIVAQSAGIPTMEWSGSGLVLDPVADRNKDGVISVSAELFAKACVSNATEGLAAVRRNSIEYPLMIRSVKGSGGWGSRKVPNEEAFNAMFAAVQVEVPKSRVFITKCRDDARLIDVAVIGDRYGNVISVGTCDSTIQRRGQRILEEAPGSIVPANWLSKMQEDAVRMAEIVGYESVGTVRFKYLPEENVYYFQCLSPYLQVEHPCTEMISKINIPGIQLQVAMGVPLHRMVEIRHMYGFRERQLYENTPLPSNLVKTDVDQHCIAARITSEDPEDYFRPSTGCVNTLEFKSCDGVTGYFSVSSSGKVHENADSQFGHLVSIGCNRLEAISKMRCALQELSDQANFAALLSCLGDILNDPDFVENRFNTQWLDTRFATKGARLVDVTIVPDSLKMGKPKKVDDKAPKFAIPASHFREKERGLVSVLMKFDDGNRMLLPRVALFVADVMTEIFSRGEALESEGMFRESSNIAVRKEFFRRNTEFIAGTNRDAKVLGSLSAKELGDYLKCFLRENDDLCLLAMLKPELDTSFSLEGYAFDQEKHPGCSNFLLIIHVLRQLIDWGLPTMTYTNLGTLFAPVLFVYDMDGLDYGAVVEGYIQTTKLCLLNSSSLSIIPNRNVPPPPAKTTAEPRVMFRMVPTVAEKKAKGGGSLRSSVIKKSGVVGGTGASGPKSVAMVTRKSSAIGKQSRVRNRTSEASSSAQSGEAVGNGAKMVPVVGAPDVKAVSKHKEQRTASEAPSSTQGDIQEVNGTTTLTPAGSAIVRVQTQLGKGSKMEAAKVEGKSEQTGCSADTNIRRRTRTKARMTLTEFLEECEDDASTNQPSMNPKLHSNEESQFDPRYASYDFVAGRGVVQQVLGNWGQRKAEHGGARGGHTPVNEVDEDDDEEISCEKKDRKAARESGRG